jgi:hypothetical protein
VPRIVKQVTTAIRKVGHRVYLSSSLSRLTSSQLEENAEYITRLRSAVEFSPRDSVAVAAFATRANAAPLPAYAAQLRAAAEEMRARLASSEVRLDTNRATERELKKEGR